MDVSETWAILDKMLERIKQNNSFLNEGFGEEDKDDLVA